MRRFSILSVAFAMLLLVGGCASHRYTVMEPAQKSVSDYSVLEIQDFKSNLTDEDSLKLADSFADKLLEEVLEDRERHPGESIFETVTRASDSPGKVLVLEGTVISFEKGSRAKRYFIGFGAGKAYCTIQARFLDKETGDEVLKTNFDGELSMSFFGGSADEAVQGVVKAFIAYFDDYFENK